MAAVSLLYINMATVTTCEHDLFVSRYTQFFFTKACNHLSVNFITCILSTQEEDDHGSRRRLSAEMIFIELVSQRIQKVFVLTYIFRIIIRFWETVHLPLP